MILMDYVYLFAVYVISDVVVCVGGRLNVTAKSDVTTEAIQKTWTTAEIDDQVTHRTTSIVPLSQNDSDTLGNRNLVTSVTDSLDTSTRKNQESQNRTVLYTSLLNTTSAVVKESDSNHSNPGMSDMSKSTYIPEKPPGEVDMEHVTSSDQFITYKPTIGDTVSKLHSDDIQLHPGSTAVTMSSTETLAVNTKAPDTKSRDHNHQQPSHVTKAVPFNRKINVPYFADKDAVKNFERKHVHHQFTFKHHLQLVPMEDPAFESDMMKNHRYLISILIPVAIGGVGALMIAGTVCTLRYIARKRPHNPFNDVTVESRAGISSVCSEQTDRMFLLQEEE